MQFSLASCIISLSFELLTYVDFFWSLDFYVAGFPKIFVRLHLRVGCKTKIRIKIKRPYTSMKDLCGWWGRFWLGLERELTVLELASLAGMPLPPGVGGMQGAEGGRCGPFGSACRLDPFFIRCLILLLLCIDRGPPFSMGIEDCPLTSWG